MSAVGAPGGIRTHDPQLRKLVLYPLSYGRICVAEREGFEPSEQVTPLGGLANRCTRPLCDLSTLDFDRGMVPERAGQCPLVPRIVVNLPVPRRRSQNGRPRV